MANKKNQIIWIIGIGVIALFFFMSSSELPELPEGCVSNEPNSLEGFHNKFKEVYGDSITISNKNYLLKIKTNWVGYADNGNIAIRVTKSNCNEGNIGNLLESENLLESDLQDIKIRIGTIIRSVKTQDGIGDFFCSTNGKFMIRFLPISSYEDKYFETFYTCD